MSNENGIKSDNERASPLLGQLRLIPAMVPIAIGLGYGLVYIYELSYSGVFKIPNEFIIISWNNIFNVAGTIFIVLVSLLLLMPFIWIYLPRRMAKWGPIRRIIVHVLASVSPLILVMVPFRNWLSLLMFIGFAIVLLLYYMLRPLMTQKNIKGYRNKLIAQEPVEQVEATKQLEIAGRYIGGDRGLIFLFVIIMLFSAAHFSGMHEAESKVEFLVPSTTQELVVLRVYGDKLICAPLDRENKEIERSFFILDMKDIYITPEEVGPLTVSSKK